MSLLQAGFGSSGGDYEITDSLRLRSSADAHLSRTNAANGNRKTFTFSGWVKYSGFLSHGDIWSSNHSSGGGDALSFRSTNKLNVALSGVNNIITTAVFRDPSAWYHIVFVLDTTQSTASNRIKLYVNGGQITTFDTVTYPSLNADAANFNTTNPQLLGKGYSLSLDGYLTEVNFIDGQALAPTDFGEYDANGTWKPKEYTGTHGTNGFYLPMKPTTQAELQNTVLYTGDGTAVSVANTGYAPDFVWIKNRDDTNHHRLYDTVRGSNQMLSSSQAAAEQTKGGGLTSFDSDGFSVGNDGSENNSGDNFVAWTWDAGDNQTSTGISGVLYSGSGIKRQVNGFGFSPDLVWIKNRLAANFHYLYDSVRGVHKSLSTNSTGAEDGYPFQLESFDSDGFTVGNDTAGYNNYPGRNYIAWGWDAGDGDPVSNTTGDINSTVKANDATGFSIVSYTGNGTSNSEQTIGHGLSTAPKVVIVKDRTSASTRWTFYSTDLSSDGTYAVKNLLLNSSAAESAYSSQIRGIQGSNTFSVRDVDANGNANVNKSGDNYIAYCFSEVSGVSKFSTYTGTGSSGKAITGLGFRPGFLMIKEISSTGNWAIVDGTRSPFGEVTGDYLYANLAQAEGGGSAPLQFDSDGFTINSGDSDTNASGQTYLYMAFKGSYSDYVSPLNTTGTIDSRVKANPSKGFSIVSYAGNNGSNQTVGHGLGVTPSMFIIKNRTDATSWPVYHKDISTPLSNAMYLNSTNAAFGWAYWGTGGLSSTVFPVHYGSADVTNQSGKDYIAYVFAEIAGYSKIDKYTGTNNTGNSVTTGFRPGFVMIKNASASASWNIIDSTRSPVSTTGNGQFQSRLFPNLANAESTDADVIEFTDTGFVINITSSSQFNNSGNTYIYMAFADTRDAVFNFDASGNKNNFNANNINGNAESESTYDLMKDTPSLVDENAGNFATWNPLRKGANVAVSEGNLKAITSATVAQSVAGTIGMSSGKWYWEVINQGGALSYTGIVDSTHDMGTYIGASSTGSGYAYNTSGQKVGPTSGTVASYGASYTTNDVIGIALDMDAGTLTFYKNNASQGTAFSSITGTWFAAVSGNGVAGKGGIVNFGQRPFEYTPPTGFLKLNTFNLPDSTIEDGSDYFNTVLYSGSSASEVSVTGVGFQPDFVWDKNRNNAYQHYLWDAVRGTTKYLVSNSNAAETTDANSLKSFDSDGFTLGAGSTFATMSAGNTHVGWAWKANGSGVSNTDGSITSTVSANTEAGFSIVSYTGTNSNSTVGHGLGVAPSMVICKNRTAGIGSGSWPVWHTGLSSGTSYLFLNSTAAQASGNNNFTSAPSSTVLNLGTSDTNNTATMIAYCFAEVPGYSAFGKYTGNGSADGTFVYTGFRPAFVIIKRSDSTANWLMYDNKRLGYNQNNNYLLPDLANAEGSGDNYPDLLSNGFKPRVANQSFNVSGGTYIYMAFAENPFKNANAR